jgi:hypothetical protein
MNFYNFTRKRRSGGLAQAVEHLPCKHKALSSNSSTAKKVNEKDIWPDYKYGTNLNRQSS